MSGRGWSTLTAGALALALAGCGGVAPRENACFAGLDRHRIAYTPVAVRGAGAPGCAVEAAVEVSRVAVPLSRPAVMSCVMASRLDQFEREAVQPLALRDLGRRVVEIEHLGAYACRANSSRHSQLSEHAFGRAIDISGFRFSDGSVALVQYDWARPGPYRRFLHDVARSACSYFSVVLTPNSNRDHFNHFHLDIGPGRVCSV
jgi:hypothetical protein